MKKKIITDIILNIIIILSVTIGMTIHFFLSLGNGPLDGGGFYIFRYFTNLSNIFCGIIAIITVIIEIRMLSGKAESFPGYLTILRQIAVTGVLVTCIFVNFVFLPILGKDCYESLYSGQKILTHVTTPVLAAVAFIFFHPGKELSWKGSFLSILPEFIYAVIYEIEVPILSNWNDFYGFTLGGKWYAPFIVAPTICTLAYICSILLTFTHKKKSKKSEN